MRKLGPILLGSLLLLAVPAAAEQIVYFTNGTTMAVMSHKIDGDMIQVDLGEGAKMSFPASTIDRVEDAGGHRVQVNAGPRNRMTSSPERDRDVANRLRAKQNEKEEPVPATISTQNGALTEQPFPNGSAAKQRLRTTGTQGIRDFRQRSMERDANGNFVRSGASNMPRTLPSAAQEQYQASGRGKAQSIRMDVKDSGQVKELPKEQQPVVPTQSGDAGSDASSGSGSGNGNN